MIARTSIGRMTVRQYDIPLGEPVVTALKPIPQLERVLAEVETDTAIVGDGEGTPPPR